MNHLPLKSAILKLFTRTSGFGTGNSPTSDFLGTHFFLDTAHSLNSSTTLFSNTSPHLIWHSVSSGLLLQVWRQAMLAAHDGFARHLANSTLHSLSKQAQVLSASTASADGTIIKIETSMATNWIMREFLQSSRTTSILFTPFSNIRDMFEEESGFPLWWWC
uniref:Uncharacterized protein n=1 Tax=Medicago truncatula TaxID=3880 RepID=I3T079_MEDTR|nr:unknown [Medicago truncatula]